MYSFIPSKLKFFFTDGIHFIGFGKKQTCFSNEEFEGCPKWKVEAGWKLIKVIPFASKPAAEFQAIFLELLYKRVELVQDSEEILTNIANIYHREWVSYK